MGCREMREDGMQGYEDGMQGDEGGWDAGRCGRMGCREMREDGMQRDEGGWDAGGWLAEGAVKSSDAHAMQ